MTRSSPPGLAARLAVASPPRAHGVPIAAAVVTVLLQIAYPLLGDAGQVAVTRASVATFLLASVAHAALTRSVRAGVAVVVVCCGLGLVAEAVGTRTGLPFGRYTYTGRLGTEILGVPLAVIGAWAMMGWPALVAGRRAGHPVLVGTALLVTWDLFLDPQMVRDGHWIWAESAWPALHGIPLSNALGWALTGAVMMAVLHRVVPRRSVPVAHDAVPFALLCWTWFSETFGHLVFFGAPSVGVTGGVAMGLVLVVAGRRAFGAAAAPGAEPLV